MLFILDYLFIVLHVVIIGFNLLGWIWPSTRKAHLVLVSLTLGCWLILGIWYGLGYCPITDWQWQIKTRLGETNLPNSFIKYYADLLTGKNISAGLIDLLTAVGFAIAILMTIYVNFIKKSPGKID